MEKHKRFIKCSQKVTYYQQVELDDEQLKLLERANDMSIIPTDPAYELLESLINPSEIFDTEQDYEGFELLEK